jgi:hypothetical protein
MRLASIRFGTLADDIRRFSEKHHRDQRNIESRLKRILPDFANRLADQIKPADIDGWLAGNTKTPATANRYRALFSLIFREALRNGKVTSNPARLVRQRHEDNGRIRFLTEDEERRMRKVITERFPEHLPELDHRSRHGDEVVGTILIDVGADRLRAQGDPSGADKEWISAHDPDERRCCSGVYHP